MSYSEISRQQPTIDPLEEAALSDFERTFHLNLNPVQRRAVSKTEGPLLLLAVPGSGKTTVLVTRLGYMIISKKINPNDILTMTYTISAAKDMARRYRLLFEQTGVAVPEFRTINGVCAKIIQYYAEHISGSAFGLETNEKNLTMLISRIYTEQLGERPTETDLKDLRTMLSYAKNSMLSASERKALDTPGLPFSQLFDAYNRSLTQNRIMDYDDQMVYAYKILQRYPEILQAYRARYRYICVDEAQDTSKIQHKLIALLARGSENLFMVGDEDQSIYGFRAAWPEALLTFADDHPGAEILLMEDNYRSQPDIVQAADRFIQKNTFRYRKHMRAVRNGDRKVSEIKISQPEEQYRMIIDLAKKSSEPFTVLYRNNESGIPLADALLRENIPFTIRQGDFIFFQSRPVKDITDFLNFALCPTDGETFSRIYFKMSLYLKKDLLPTVLNTAALAKVPLLDAVRFCRSCSGGTRAAAVALADLLETVRISTASEALRLIINDCGYDDYFNRVGLNRNTLRMLQQLALKCATVKDFLNRLGELPILLNEPREGSIQLSTIHSAKGLEFNTVYLLDVFDGIFPEKVIPDITKTDTETLKAYEEERRLFYVAVTRARDRLCLFTSPRSPGSFCRELLSPSAKPRFRATTPPVMDFERFCDALVCGTTVIHRIHGRGLVAGVDRNNLTVTLSFDDGNPRLFSLQTLFDRELLTVPQT